MPCCIHACIQPQAHAAHTPLLPLLPCTHPPTCACRTHNHSLTVAHNYPPAPQAASDLAADAVEVLLRAGADPSPAVPADQDTSILHTNYHHLSRYLGGWTALHFAVRAQMDQLEAKVRGVQAYVGGGGGRKKVAFTGPAEAVPEDQRRLLQALLRAAPGEGLFGVLIAVAVRSSVYRAGSLPTCTVI